MKAGIEMPRHIIIRLEFKGIQEAGQEEQGRKTERQDGEQRDRSE